MTNLEVRTTVLRVSEIFGPTFQGEGPTTGRLATFLRLGGCNLDCSWCDTPYTWDWERYDRDAEVTAMPIDDVYTRLEDAPGMLVITGGEPTIQTRALTTLINLLPPRRIEIETNGTHGPEPLFDNQLVHFNVSPKLANSGIAYERRIKPMVLGYYAEMPRATFKFVVSEPGDLDEVDQLADTFGIDPAKLWIMPEGTTVADLLLRARRLTDDVLARGWNFTLRSHTLIWGADRGR